jgi:hypothetical protein
VRSFANLPEAQTTTYSELSAHDVLRADWILFSDRTLPSSPDVFSGTHLVDDGDLDDVAADSASVEVEPSAPAEPEDSAPGEPEDDDVTEEGDADA